MSKSKNQVSLRDFIVAVYGVEYDGQLGLWSKQTKRTKFFTSTDLESFIEEVKICEEQEDLYIPISTQMKDLGPFKRGTIDEINSVFMFVADIDFANKKDSSKNYPTNEKVALGILDTFEHPPSFYQNSGNGLHVGWALPTPIKCNNRSERRRAQKKSKAFQKKLISHYKKNGFEIDSVGDVTRVFRVPNSNNHKTKPPKKVKMLYFEPKAKLDWAMLDNVVELKPDKSHEYERYFEPVNHSEIQNGCGWYAYHTGIGASQSTEPDWFGVIGITACCENAEEIVHEYSSLHPEYDPGETQNKFNRAQSEFMPRTCKFIAEDLGGESFCKKCAYFKQIKSPVQLGNVYRPGQIGPIPIGCLQNGSFVLQDQRRNILITLTSNQLLSAYHLVGLAPSEFWRFQYPTKSGFDSMAAGEALIEACKKAGPFDPGTIRGLGIWRDGSIIVENLGGPIPADASYAYLCFNPPIFEKSKHGELDVDQLYELIGKFPWRHSQDAILILGWLMLAPMCGALMWRVHMFMYGPANSGKTTLHNLASNLLAPLRVNADGQSTEAGVRQKLGPDALPVVMDEFETDQSQGKLAAMFRLARSASSAESQVLRGTPEGKAMQFAIKTAFLFSAINVAGKSQADESRIVTVELTAHESDPETGKTIEETMQMFSDMGPTWNRYVADNTMLVLDTIDILKAEMPPMDSRHVKNMSTLLAGGFVALHGAVPTIEEAVNWIEQYRPTIDRHAIAHERDDATESLNYLLAHRVRSETGDGEYPLGHWMAVAIADLEDGKARPNRLSEAERIMAIHQIKIVVSGKEQGAMIANGAPPIDRIFADTKWANGAWKRSIGQIPGTFSPKNPIRIPGLQGKPRCLGIPLELIPDRLDDFGKNKDF